MELEPWGTLQPMPARSKLKPLIDTNCFLLLRQDAKQLLEIPLMP